MFVVAPAFAQDANRGNSDFSYFREFEEEFASESDHGSSDHSAGDHGCDCDCGCESDCGCGLGCASRGCKGAPWWCKGGPGHAHNNHDIKHGRVDTHAPAHLFGDHAHKKGQWMVEYKYMNMYMDGNRAGTSSLTDLEALNFLGAAPPPNGFGATPLSMTMEMHMMHVMYGLNDCFTAYIMPMWQVNTMDHARRPSFPNNNFRVTNSGFGDFAFGTLWKAWENETDELIFNIGFSAPTGDIDRQSSIPTASLADLPYPMRLGSGTWDARPGVTYKRFWDYWSAGVQAQFDLPMGFNDQNYRMGNEYRLNTWVTRVLDCEKRFAVSFRVEALFKSNYVGADPDLNPMLISTARSDMRGGEFINFGYGAMYWLPCGGRLNFEVAHKVYQNLRGVQLEQDWSLATSWSKAF